MLAVIGSTVSFFISASQSISELATGPQWHSLLHIESGDASIYNDEFYLSQTRDPELELLATISAFQQPASGSIDSHPLCRFPARRLWLENKTGLQFPSLNCQQFKQWKDENQTTSFSLVFVTGYLGNPASFFGHLLVKMNDQNGGETDLFDTSINYGANADRDDNPVKYVTYGLFGGYDASFSDVDYYQLEYSYAENEQRELWEYELNLTEEEVALLEAHLWELQGMRFRYLFLSANCASQIAKLFDIVLNEPLLKSGQPWDMPLDVFKSIVNIEHHGEPLVRSVNKRTSKFTRIHDKYLALSEQEQAMTQKLVKSPADLNAEQFDRLAVESKQKIISLLFDYYELAIGYHGEASAKKIKQSLLVKSLSLPAANIDWPERKTEPPHEAQNPNRIALAAGMAEKPYLSLNYRAGYYDFLARSAARYPNSNAVFFSTEVRFDQDNLWLQRFDLFDVTTLNIIDVPLFEESRWAWRSKLSVEQASLETRDDLRTRFYAGIGWAGQRSLSWYMIPNLMVDFAYIDQSRIGADLGLIYLTEAWKSHLLVHPWLDGSNQRNVKVSFDNRYGDSVDWDIRFIIEYDQMAQASIGYSHYF
ncbi:DUF4105 domain-containing protein [Vibrio sp. SCSIO 43136]|uniref:Lnb N-terminal periplasmic domain-containing protein n=1 Tax=Vibrio sp. SCSIO 43136 TaxID=2819101 RepID=UPI0020757DA4|nr:DUF4105 domain-containing protein [Vibrio sp. SCSIO 43136]USD68067.1 DUF4105 domain-containing protein [Vibrio sp. SCSIO 43136]